MSATAPDEMIGAVVDHYLITEKLREGSGGVLYAARHPALGRPAVIKLMRWGDPQFDPDIIAELFFAEGRAACQVQHANVVSIFNFGRLDSGRLYLVMEHLQGETLEAVLEKGAMTLGQVQSIGGQILAALAACHEAGIVHRDIKPENLVLLPRPGGYLQVKLIDFGIAASASVDLGPAVRFSKAMLGTPLYMAPEQTGKGPAREIDHRADLYSFGMVLYRMATGVHPFEAATLEELLDKQAYETPPAPRSLRPELPEALDGLVMRCLAKDPEERPTSATEVLSALRGIINPAPSSAPSPGFSLPVRPPKPRAEDSLIPEQKPSPWPARLAFAGAGLGLGLLLGFLLG